ncbi:phage tail assembly protein [Dyella sp. 2RAF44]|uniref:phage tail assembly protein n=1 Tax=Dyella sp. 2RAF44 TaxID=3233000 RepID=UPI003F902528
MAKAKNSDTPSYIAEGDGQAVITLAAPATINGEKVTQITMREPTVGDMKRLQKHKGDEAEKEIYGVSSLCEISTEDVEGLSLRNFARVQEAFALFSS